MFWERYWQKMAFPNSKIIANLCKLLATHHCYTFPLCNDDTRVTEQYWHVTAHVWWVTWHLWHAPMTLPLLDLVTRVMKCKQKWHHTSQDNLTSKYRVIIKEGEVNMISIFCINIQIFELYSQDITELLAISKQILWGKNLYTCGGQG